MIPAIGTDIERANLLSKTIKLMCDLNSMAFFNDLVISVQPVLVSNIDKCTEPVSKELLRQSVDSLLVHMSDSESKTLFTQTRNKLT